MITDEEVTCKGCIFLDEYFGDCCHPEVGGVGNPLAYSECAAKNHHLKETASNTGEPQ